MYFDVASICLTVSNQAFEFGRTFRRGTLVVSHEDDTLHCLTYTSTDALSSNQPGRALKHYLSIHVHDTAHNNVFAFDSHSSQ